MSFFEQKNRGVNPAVNLAASVFAGLGLLISFTTLNQVSKINSTKTPTLVETSDGKSLRVTAIGHYERTPEAIQEFVGSKFFGLFEWTGYLPPQNSEEVRNPKRDPGIKIGDRSVTTIAFNTASALSEDFRKPFLEGLADITPQAIFQKSNKPGQNPQSILYVRSVSHPRQMTKARFWEVDVVADLIITKNQDQLGTAIPLNKTVTVFAVDTPPLPEWASEEQKMAHEERKAGLEITQMRDINLGSPSQMK